MAELLLDIGNSRTKAVLHQAGVLTLLSGHQAEFLQSYAIDSVFCASVAAAERIEQVRQESGLLSQSWCLIRSEAEKNGLKNQYQQPALLGVDRWLAMLGAKELYPAQDLLVIDAGTALTLDWVGADGQHLGGWIIPGFRLQQQAVIGHTAKVFNNSMQHAEVAIGTDTSSCLQNGCLAAAVAVVKQAVQMQQLQQIVLTGGDAPLLVPHLQAEQCELDPLLIFRGLSLYIDKNCSKADFG